MRTAVSESDPLEAEDGDYGQLGQRALPEDGSGMTVQPSWLE